MERAFATLLPMIVLSALGHGQGVTVDASANVILGDRPEISASLSGLMAFERGPAVVADADCRARIAALRPECIRDAAAPKTGDG